MSEEEWLSCEDPTPMLECLRGKVSDRKLWLFRVACCRRIWDLLNHIHSRAAVEAAEQFADGEIAEDERAKASRLASAVYYGDFEDDPDHNSAKLAAGVCVCQPNDAGLRCESHLSGALDVAGCACAAAGQVIAERLAPGQAEEDMPRWRVALVNAEAAERSAQCRLVGDIFGNPFRPVSVEHAWLTSTVVALARQMYESRDFGAMPILADALQDAGCDSEEVLNHCRGPGLLSGEPPAGSPVTPSCHVRGCWVVDLVLGKE